MPICKYKIHILFFFTFILSSFTVEAQNSPQIQLKTVVIDAGHGGHDPGAVSPDRKMQEKTINLDVALKLGEMIKAEYPEIKVIYTRDKDVFISLNERTNIANRNHADLFISIHVNSAPGKSSSASGIEVFVMGTDKNASNMEVSRRENSVILLEDDYSTTYQGYDPNSPESYIFFNLMQNAYFEQSVTFASYVDDNLKKGPIMKSRGVKQEPLLVLWRTTMPSILVEIGFISSSSDRSKLGNNDSRKEIASNIFKAFKQFKVQYETGVEPISEDEDNKNDLTEPVETVKETPKSPEKVEENNEVEIFCTIQILASKKQIREGSSDFKGLTEIQEIFWNGFYKYCIGKYQDKTSAKRDLDNVRKLFPQAFIITVDKKGHVL